MCKSKLLESRQLLHSASPLSLSFSLVQEKNMGFSLLWWFISGLGFLAVRNRWLFGESRLGVEQGGFNQTTLGGDHQDKNPQKHLRASLLGERVGFRWPDLPNPCVRSCCSAEEDELKTSRELWAALAAAAAFAVGCSDAACSLHPSAWGRTPPLQG